MRLTCELSSQRAILRRGNVHEQVAKCLGEVERIDEWIKALPLVIQHNDFEAQLSAPLFLPFDLARRTFS